MYLFEKSYKKVLDQYNKKPLAPGSLDPFVFYFPGDGLDPCLMPGIQSQIIEDIERINNSELPNVKTRVWNYIITGSILKEKASKNCDIVVRVQLNTYNLVDTTKERILQTIKNINGKLAYGTLHPLIYIPTIRPLDPQVLNGAYDPFKNLWIKKPSFLEESSKTSLENISKINIKKNPKQSLSKGLKKLGKV
jgi:hypothetical protein